MLDDDAVIAESWQQPERFAVLFDRHAAYIHRYLARRTDSQAAEDLVAETFLTAFRKRRRYQHGYANARPWLYGIATHLLAPTGAAATYKEIVTVAVLVAETPVPRCLIHRFRLRGPVRCPVPGGGAGKFGWPAAGRRGTLRA